MEITKDYEGRLIYALPTGNHARRGRDQEIITFEVVKVKRKYVDLRREGWKYTDAYCLETGATQQAINSGYAYNAGYMFFPSLEAIEEYKRVSVLKGDIREWSSGFNVTKNLTTEQIEGIWEILFGGDDVQVI